MKWLDKILSARFIMSVTVTIVGCFLTYSIVQKFHFENKELVTFVVGQYFIIWSNIAKDYFVRSDRASEQVSEQKEKSNEKNNVSSTT